METLILNSLFFLFPLFFLPITQEYFITNKFYLLILAIFLLLLTSVFKLFTSKKLVIKPNSLDVPVILIVLSIGLTTFITTTNKFQSILNPNFGLLTFVALGIYYFYLSRSKGNSTNSNFFQLIPTFLSLITIIFFFQPFAKANLPINLTFLKNPNFSFLGSQLDLTIVLGFFLIFSLFNLKKLTGTSDLRFKVYHLGSIVLTLIALIISISSLFRPGQLVLPPFNLSWYAAIEVLKNPITAFFGAGVENFSIFFTRVKDLAYNQSVLWQIASFNYSRSAILHILTEVGLFGLIAFGFLIFSVLKQVRAIHESTLHLISFVYLFIYLLFFPPSLVVWFLLFTTLSIIAQGTKQSGRVIELDELSFVYFGIVFVSFLLIGVSGFLLARNYLSEYYFKKSITGLANNNAKEVYDNMRKARVLNPFTERYVLNFSQTNLVFADNLARKDPTKITEADRQSIAQAVQAGISEAKGLVNLNPGKAGYWENLALIYQNIIPIASGSDAWSISSYQRAILLDPSNPNYRLRLGGIYFLLGQYQDAVRFFEQTAQLKPDWPNAHYNLAWAYFQTQQYDKATAAMKNVTNLVDKKTSPQDWEKANQDLENFKDRLANEEKQASQESSLNLPEKSTNELDPKLQLPPEASPEAR
ncbi:tetratricopeptide repeat protein [Candidatus Roizmanbacteria bacterium]|nr:tetratricopeptide repeat protein [Candidatus Roizmanbacteria bacterium]